MYALPRTQSAGLFIDISFDFKRLYFKKFLIRLPLRFNFNLSKKTGKNLAFGCEKI